MIRCIKLQEVIKKSPEEDYVYKKSTKYSWRETETGNSVALRGNGRSRYQGI